MKGEVNIEMDEKCEYDEMRGVKEVGERVRAYVGKVREMCEMSPQTGMEHERDKLAVEYAKNARFLHELRYLQSEISARDKEVISLSLIIQQMKLEAGQMEGRQAKLQRDLEETRTKNARLEDQILNYESNITSLTQKIDYQDHFFSKKLEDMKKKFDEYLEKMVEMDFRVEESQKREYEWPLILERVHKASEEEYNRFKTEMEGLFGQRISSIQSQLDAEVSENAQLKQINDDLNQKVLHMHKTDVEMCSKIKQLEKQNEILEQAIKKEKVESDKTVKSLHNKIKQLQDTLRQDVEDVKTGKYLGGAQIKGEIEFIKRLLSEEEERLNIVTKDRQLFGDDMKQNLENDNDASNASEEDDDDERKNEYMNNTSTDEFLQYETESAKPAFQGFGQDELRQYMNELSALNHEEECTQWTKRPTDTFIQTSSVVGPVFYSEHVVGPVRPLSSIPHPPVDRPPRPSSANQRGIRSKTVCSQQECVVNKDCPSTASNHRADSGLGQSPDYLDSVFKKKDKESNNIDSDSISLTCVKVMEVNKDGKYIRISNNSDTQDAEIGSYMVKQNRFSHPVALFRFPERLKLPANATVTIWSGSNDPLLHQPPTDFFCSEPLLWGSGPEYTTILCNSSGQAVSWTTQPHRIHPDPYRAKTAPTIRKDSKRESNKKLPELILNNNSTLIEQPFLIMDNNDTMSHPTYYPFTSTPKSSIHPCIENNRGKISGNDNSSFNRQTRQQNDGIPDPMIGQPYSGTNIQRMLGSARVLRYYPGDIKPSHSLNNRTPDVIFRSNTEPPNTFQKPSAKFMTGLDQVQSMHNHFYNPPMFKVEADSSAN